MKKMTDLEKAQLYLWLVAILAVIAANTAPWLWLSFVAWFIAIATTGATWALYFLNRREWKKNHR